VRDLVVVPGDGGIAGKIGLGIKVVARRVDVVVEDGGEQDDAVEGDAVVVERGDQSGGARVCRSSRRRGTWAGPALVHGDVAGDELVEGLDVLVDAGEVLGGALAHGAGEAGERRVDEDEVGLVDQAVLVGNPLIGRRAAGLGALSNDAHRADGAHVQPEGRGAGAAVVEEGDGAGLGGTPSSV
jgi:hypothetical protein